MPGKSGLPNLNAMSGRRKGGACAPQAITLKGIAAHAAAFLESLAARAYSQPSIDAHHWALRQFTAWADSRGTHDPAAFTRADLEAYQLFLHHYRSPRGGKPLVTNTQLARLGCIRRFFAWLCRSGTITAKNHERQNHERHKIMRQITRQITRDRNSRKRTCGLLLKRSI